MLTKCPNCGAGQLMSGRRDISYSYKGETTTISGVSGDFCSACDEHIVDTSESSRVSTEMLAFNKRVNATMVDPHFIARVRHKLDLDQREAAEMFGGGVNAFSRYENGKTRPPLALVKLFRLLDSHPELMAEIKSA